MFKQKNANHRTNLNRKWNKKRRLELFKNESWKWGIKLNKVE